MNVSVTAKRRGECSSAVAIGDMFFVLFCFVFVFLFFFLYKILSLFEGHEVLRVRVFCRSFSSQRQVAQPVLHGVRTEDAKFVHVTFHDIGKQNGTGVAGTVMLLNRPSGDGDRLERAPAEVGSFSSSEIFGLVEE